MPIQQEDEPNPYAILKKFYFIGALVFLGFDIYCLYKEQIKVQIGVGIPTDYKIVTLQNHPTEFWIIILICGVIGATLLGKSLKIERDAG